MKPESRDQLAGIRRQLLATRAAVAERAQLRRVESERRCREGSLFQAATRDVVTLRADARPVKVTPPAPVTLQHLLDEQAALASSLSDGIDSDGLLDSDDALSFTRTGVNPQTVRKLRRGQWIIQAQLDLHGLTRDDARVAVADFIRRAVRDGIRCVRVVHGKGNGSINREPVLKGLARRWLAQTLDVLAYTQARAADGGAGAMIVLLRGGRHG